MDEFIELDDFEKDSKLRKILTIIGGLFLLFLLTSYFLLGSSLFPILESVFESRESKDNVIKIDEDTSIVFEGDTNSHLQQIYFQDVSKEFAVCLFGEKESETYYVKEIFIPEIIEQSFNHVRFKSCPKETLILLHSHPFRKCIASEQDLTTLENLKQNNNQSLIVIMCEPNRFSIYD
ncbi:hypothetical protein HN865_05340 [Candidatus Woesearchaeota archaeon]|nr:hypothetical protein [Candidatus Woesearchaeota archaeon]MBT7238241.1 hypothetical protein [Candidatus Woesearchaeota archaeon]